MNNRLEMPEEIKEKKEIRQKRRKSAHALIQGRIIPIALFFCMFLTGAYTLSAADPEAKPPFIIGSSYNSYVMLPRPEDVKYNLYTHVFYAFLRPDKTGNLTLTEPGQNIETVKKLISSAHENQVKVILSFGGWGCENFPAAFGDGKKVVDFVEKYDFDGLDIAWMYPQTEEDGKAFSLLAKTLREELNKLGKVKSKKYLLTASVGGVDWNSRYIPKEAILENLDFIKVLAYDLSGYRDQPAGSHSPLFTCSGYPVSCQDLLEYWSVTKGIPKDKIVMGIPFYGRGFTGYKPFDIIGDTPSQLWDKTWTQISNLIAREKWTREFDEKSVSVLYFSPDKNMFVGCDDPQTVIAKTKWVKTNGYLGVFSWTMHADSAGVGVHPLAEAIKEASKEEAVKEAGK